MVQPNAEGKRELLSVSNLYKVVLFPHFFSIEHLQLGSVSLLALTYFLCGKEDKGNGLILGLLFLQPWSIHGDVSSCSYCSLDTRGSQKVWYKASDLLQCCAQRTGFRRRSTVTVTCFWFNLGCSDELQAESWDLSVCCSLWNGAFSVL